MEKNSGTQPGRKHFVAWMLRALEKHIFALGEEKESIGRVMGVERKTWANRGEDYITRKTRLRRSQKVGGENLRKRAHKKT